MWIGERGRSGQVLMKSLREGTVLFRLLRVTAKGLGYAVCWSSYPQALWELWCADEGGGIVPCKCS